MVRDLLKCQIVGCSLDRICNHLVWQKMQPHSVSQIWLEFSIGIYCCSSRFCWWAGPYGTGPPFMRHSLDGCSRKRVDSLSRKRRTHCLVDCLKDEWEEQYWDIFERRVPLNNFFRKIWELIAKSSHWLVFQTVLKTIWKKHTKLNSFFRKSWEIFEWRLYESSHGSHPWTPPRRLR